MVVVIMQYQWSDSAAEQYLGRLRQRLNGQMSYVSSGFPLFDTQFPAWLNARNLIILAGRPGMGKSAWGQQVAEGIAAHGRSVLLFSLEMGADTLTERAVSRRTGISVPRLQTAHVTQEDWGSIGVALDDLSHLPMAFNDETTAMSRIRLVAQEWLKAIQDDVGRAPKGAVVIDYLQLVTATGPTRNLEIARITQACKAMAKELDLPVLVLSQLNRDVENRENKRPMLSDLRDSGAIEQDADLVLMLYRSDYYKNTSADSSMAELIVAKNRHGPTGVAYFIFHHESMRFTEASTKKGPNTLAHNSGTHPARNTRNPATRRAHTESRRTEGKQAKRT